MQATPLILTGLAAALAFRLQIWNIGGEGQLYLGAVFASASPSRSATAAGRTGHRAAAHRRCHRRRAVRVVGRSTTRLSGHRRDRDDVDVQLRRAQPHQLPRVRERERVARSGDLLVPAGPVLPDVFDLPHARPPGHRRARRRGAGIIGWWALRGTLGVRVPGHRRLRVRPATPGQHRRRSSRRSSCPGALAGLAGAVLVAGPLGSFERAA